MLFSFCYCGYTAARWQPQQPSSGYVDGFRRDKMTDRIERSNALLLSNITRKKAMMTTRLWQ